MILPFLTFDKHVIHIYIYVPPILLAEHLVYQSLVRSSRILQTERQDLVAIKPLAGDEGDLLLILLCHLYLVVSGEGVHKGKKLVPNHRVHKLVNPGQREAVLRAGAIQIHEVDAHSPFLVCLFDHDNVGQPLRIVDFPNEVSSKLLVHLVHDYFVSFKSKNSSSLLTSFFSGSTFRWC